MSTYIPLDSLEKLENKASDFTISNDTLYPTVQAVAGYVNNAVAASNPTISVKTATKAVLPNSPVYANGSSGVGATLTAGSNATLVVNGYSPSVDDRVLVKNQASSFENGIYKVTTVGSGSVKWVLTRATDYDDLTNINGGGVIPVEIYINSNGDSEANTLWLLTSHVTTIGTDSLIFSQYTLGSNIVAINTLGLNQFASTTSAQLAGVISDETGSGSLVFSNSPTLVTPALGTPSALVLTNATGLPVNGLSDTGTNVGSFLKTPTSANLAAAMTDETGTGSLVFATNPTIVKPKIDADYGAIGSYSPSGGGTATIDLSLNNKSTINFPAGNITIALSNASVGQCFLLRLVQDSVGSRTVTWFTTIKWAGGSAPTLTTTANKIDVFGFICTGSGTYDGFIIGQNL